MNYYVYAIQSQKDGRIYAGMSSDIKKRVNEHNHGRIFSTKGYIPWKIILTEHVGDRKEARKREKYLKSGCGKEFLKQHAKLKFMGP